MCMYICWRMCPAETEGVDVLSKQWMRTPLISSRDEAIVVYYSAVKIHTWPACFQKPTRFVFLPELSIEMLEKHTVCMFTL